MSTCGGHAMHLTHRGFTLPEVLIAMTIGSVLLLGAARFLPALQRAMLAQTRQQALEDEIWQRLYTMAKHVQRAGYCRGLCSGQPLVINPQASCIIVQWDGNSNGVWDRAPAKEPDQTGFRLHDGALETRRGATSCQDKSWDKMTEPETITVEQFSVTHLRPEGFHSQLTLTLAASVTGHPDEHIIARHSVTGYNL